MCRSSSKPALANNVLTDLVLCSTSGNYCHDSKTEKHYWETLSPSSGTKGAELSVRVMTYILSPVNQLFRSICKLMYVEKDRSSVLYCMSFIRKDVEECFHVSQGGTC